MRVIHLFPCPHMRVSQCCPHMRATLSHCLPTYAGIQCTIHCPHVRVFGSRMVPARAGSPWCFEPARAGTEGLICTRICGQVVVHYLPARAGSGYVPPHMRALHGPFSPHMRAGNCCLQPAYAGMTFLCPIFPSAGGKITVTHCAWNRLALGCVAWRNSRSAARASRSTPTA